jgi:hypothetical protein
MVIRTRSNQGMPFRQAQGPEYAEGQRNSESIRSGSSWVSLDGIRIDPEFEFLNNRRQKGMLLLAS